MDPRVYSPIPYTQGTVPRRRLQRCSKPGFRTRVVQFDNRVWEWKDMCLLNVMLVKAVGGDDKGNGDSNSVTVERIGVGVIHEDAWAAARPARRFVKLG